MDGVRQRAQCAGWHEPAYDLSERRNFFVLLLIDLVFVVTGAVVLLTLSVLIILVPAIWETATQWLPHFRDFTAWITWLRFPVMGGLLLAMLIAAHQFLPARRHRLKEIMPGIWFTLTLWLVISAAYGEFLARFSSYASTYAGLAGVIIALMFVYLSGAALIFGGEINQAYSAYKARNDGQSR